MLFPMRLAVCPLFLMVKLMRFLLPHVMDFNFIAAPGRFGQIAECMGIDTRVLTQREAGNAAIRFVQELSIDIGTPQRLSDLGITDSVIHSICLTALEDACMITNPRDMTLEQAKKLVSPGSLGGRYMLEDKQEMIALLTGVKSSKRNYYTELKETVGQLRICSSKLLAK
ncbi:hypothetical protein GCM10020331_028340 [Ectobacillus funiculus]